PLIPPPASPTLFPYTTLFRSEPGLVQGRAGLARPGSGLAHQHDVVVHALGEVGGVLGEQVQRNVVGAADVSGLELARGADIDHQDRKSTRLNSSHVSISYAVF